MDGKKPGQYMYFMYSPEQRKLRKEVEANIGRKYTPGKVLSNGSWREFTEIKSTNISRHSDAIVVAEGYLDQMKYKNFTSV